MKLTVQQIWDATVVLTQIINEKRPMSQKGKYRIARLHAKLKPEFDIISTRRDDLIASYGTPELVPDEQGGMRPSERFMVPPEHVGEFNKEWLQVLTEEAEVDIAPLSIALFDLGDGTNGCIEATELLQLGPLVEE